MIHQVEESKNALEDSTQSKVFINKENIFSKDVLVALLSEMGFILPIHKPDRDLPPKEYKLVSKLEELCMMSR